MGLLWPNYHGIWLEIWGSRVQIPAVVEHWHPQQPLTLSCHKKKKKYNDSQPRFKVSDMINFVRHSIKKQKLLDANFFKRKGDKIFICWGKGIHDVTRLFTKEMRIFPLAGHLHRYQIKNPSFPHQCNHLGSHKPRLAHIKKGLSTCVHFITHL